MKYLATLILSLAVAAQAQSDFRAYAGMEESLEGGRTQKLTVISSDLQFNIVPPRSWACQTIAAERKLVFTSPSGRSAITVQFTGNSPGELPDNDVLREQALRAHPGAGVLQTSVCPTGYRPAVFFDLVMMPTPGKILKLRHAFISEPAGVAEIVLSANDDEFDQYRPVIMGMLRNFRATRLKPGTL